MKKAVFKTFLGGAAISMVVGVAMIVNGLMQQYVFNMRNLVLTVVTIMGIALAYAVGDIITTIVEKK